MNRKQNTTTIPRLLKQRVNKSPADIAYMEKNVSGMWQDITWRKFYDKVNLLASGLVRENLEPGDQIAILLPNCIMWEVAQQAAYLAGCVIVGLDINDPPQRVSQIIELSNIRAVVVQDTDPLSRFPLEWLDSIKLTLVMENKGNFHASGRVLEMNELITNTPVCNLPQIKASDVATILFTSGTTGCPKAIVYAHDQLVAAVGAIIHQVKDIPEQASGACWLPLSNPFQRICNLCGIKKNWQTYMVPDPKNILQEVQDIKPQFFIAVPRFYEKVYEGIQKQIKSLPFLLRSGMGFSFFMRRIYLSLKRANSIFSMAFEIPNKIADFLFFKKVRSVLGGKVQYFISGSAPMPGQLLRQYHAMGWLILESYGISENIIPMSMNTPDDFRLGSAGKPLPENTIKLDDSGQILVRGVGVSRKGVELTSDGYLETGDIGRIDKNGYLILCGRKADTFKLSTGRKIAPMIIESALKEIEEVSHALIDGTNQKYVVAMLNIEAEHKQSLIDQFYTPEKVYVYLKQKVDQVCKGLPHYCRPAEFFVVFKSFSVETGELTPNLKLKRKYVLEQYRHRFNDLYKTGEMVQSYSLGIDREEFKKAFI